LSTLSDLSGQLTSAGSSNFGGLPLEEVRSRFDTSSSLLDQRRSALADELVRQQEHEKIRVSFAQAANDFNSWLEKQKGTLAVAEGTLQNQLDTLRKHNDQLPVGQSKFDAVGDLNKKLEENKITDNKHTNHTLRNLQAEYKQFLNNRSDREKLLEKEIMIQQGKNVSAEQIAEFKEVFQHFDSKNRGSLEKHEFKACLQSLGEDMSDSEMDKLMSTVAGPDGKIHFNDFVTFMINRSTESWTVDALVDNMKILANDKDFILEEDLRRVLPSEKVDALLRTMPAHATIAGAYDYKAWAQQQVGRV